MKILLINLIVMIFYYPGLDPSLLAQSNWERVKSPGNNDVIYPKDYATTDVAIGTNNNVAGLNKFKFLVVENNAFIALLDNLSPEKGVFMIYSGTKEYFVKVLDNKVETVATDNAGKQITVTQDESIYTIVANDGAGKTITQTIDVSGISFIQVIDTVANTETVLAYNGSDISFIKTDNNTATTVLAGCSDLEGFRVTVNAVTKFQVNPLGLIYESLPAYDDDAAAGAGGLITGNAYQTTGAGAAPLNVPGIRMVKQ